MKSAGKVPVILQKEVPGFIANRMQLAFLREAFWLYENGVASAKDIDTVVNYHEPKGIVASEKKLHGFSFVPSRVEFTRLR